MGNEGYLTYGHIHEPHGVWQHDGVVFCNYGALSRGSLDEYNLHRQVGVTIWDTDKPPERAFEFVPLKAKPAEEVFRLERHAAAVTAQRSLEAFQAGLSAVELSVLSVESVIAHIREGGHPAEVAALAEELLTAQQGGA
jgi:DNA repair exonuclease SbcCD nuclease subunit